MITVQLTKEQIRYIVFALDSDSQILREIIEDDQKNGNDTEHGENLEWQTDIDAIAVIRKKLIKSSNPKT